MTLLDPQGIIVGVYQSYWMTWIA